MEFTMEMSWWRASFCRMALYRIKMAWKISLVYEFILWRSGATEVG